MKALFNRLRYPKTDAGRKRYVRHGMKPKYRISITFAILILLGAVGTIVTLLMCLNGHCSFLLAIASMGLFILGVQNIENREP